MPTTTYPKYGILNTRNMQRLLDDCLQQDATLRTNVLDLLRTNVYAFFNTYFELHPHAATFFQTVETPEIWGNCLATAIERGIRVWAEMPDPSGWVPTDLIVVINVGIGPLPKLIWITIKLRES